MNDLYEDVIFTDSDFEMERDHVKNKDQEKSFIDFYSSRKNLRNSKNLENSNFLHKSLTSRNNNSSINNSKPARSFRH